ncbi:hypothetical protein ABN702_06790 [Bacillus haimaensis]|uniref:GerMN domain-containing protein n=1 Tax=Bacillus haimaensis TaxID=3160967 RepID=UPI003AA8E2D0
MRHKQRMEEEQLEKLLRQMPKMKDDRDPKQIYREVYDGLNKKPRSFNVIPALALAAAVLIFAIISPLFLQNLSGSNSSMDQAARNSDGAGIMESSERDDSADSAKEESVGIQSVDEDAQRSLEESEIALDGAKESDNNDFTALSADQPTFVVTNEKAKEMMVVTIGVTATEPQSNIGPFTFPVSVEVPLAEGGSYEENLESIKNELDYIAMGVEEPLLNRGAVVTIAQDGDGNEMPSVEMKNLYYDLSSSQDFQFNNEIAETFRYKYLQYQFTRDGKNKNVEYGNSSQTGPVETVKMSKKGYHKFINRQGNAFLVPTQVVFKDINQALDSMREGADIFEEQSGVDPSIPMSITIESVQVKDDSAIVVLSDKSVMENTIENIFALESILMTAKEFGFTQVIFKTTQEGLVGNVPLNEPVNVPYSPNPITMPQ